MLLVPEDTEVPVEFVEFVLDELELLEVPVEELVVPGVLVVDVWVADVVEPALLLASTPVAVAPTVAAAARPTVAMAILRRPLSLTVMISPCSVTLRRRSYW